MTGLDPMTFLTKEKFSEIRFALTSCCLGSCHKVLVRYNKTRRGGVVSGSVLQKAHITYLLTYNLL